MAVSLMAVLDGVADTLAMTTGVVTMKSYDELTEGVDPFDCPRLHVFPQAGVCDPSGNTDRTTFSSGVQQVELTIFVDLFARQRSELQEDMMVTVEMVDSLMNYLQTLERPPFFGVEGIKSFSWRWQRDTFKFAKSYYMGARFTLIIKCF